MLKKKIVIKSILFSPAAASFDQFVNFEKRGKNLKIYVNHMQENSFKFFFINYWRTIDKKILICFLSFFFWDYSFHFPQHLR